MFTGDHGHDPAKISLMDPMSGDENSVAKSCMDMLSDKDIDLVSNSNDYEGHREHWYGSLTPSSPDPDSPSPGFLGKSSGMSEYELEGSKPIGTSTSNIGNGSGPGDNDTSNDGNFENSDLVNFQQGYGHELLSQPPAKRVNDFESNSEDVEPHLPPRSPGCGTLQKSLKMHVSQGIKPQLQIEEDPCSPRAHLTPAVGKYESTKANHQLVIKMTKSLYCLALITSNPWATMVELHKNIMGVHSRFRNQFKQAAQKHVPSFYGLVNMSPESISGKVAIALANGNYRAKMFAAGKTWTGLYEHPCISAVINEGYFLNDKSEGVAHFMSFTPQMPIPTVCFAVTAIKAALSEYATGIYKPAEFSAKVWAPDYEAEVANWKFWASKDDENLSIQPCWKYQQHNIG
ncbi:hypothetical protein BS47DRAFT_1361866 [Hydnum rufescens UP504]|uniref:DUF6532 domain-containing protein n=1 Tax=Hydnum rufescens UP504 TaxID=1448309 RepID=A0A9P6AYL4_9AGAM|nr:hypothetical protein BS47DRAFT_1361866 [Hydnum rufescens UP504]